MLFNPFIPDSVKCSMNLTHPLLQINQKSITQSHQDRHGLQRYWFWSAGLKGLNKDSDQTRLFLTLQGIRSVI